MTAEDDETLPYRQVRGVWVAVRRNEYFKPEVISVHSGELEARRAAMEHFSPDAGVLFVPWDGTIEDAEAASQARVSS